MTNNGSRTTTIPFFAFIGLVLVSAISCDGSSPASTVSGATTSLPRQWSSIELVVTDATNRSVSIVSLGAPLELRLTLNGTVYSSIMPRDCYMANKETSYQKVTFVMKNCPKRMPDDLGGQMERISKTFYKLSFKAFSFNPTAVSWVDIICQVTLCIVQNEEELCNQNCWATGDEQRHGPLLNSIIKTGGNMSRATAIHKLGDADTATESINLIVTNKNYSAPTPVFWTTPVYKSPEKSPNILYIMYGLTALFAFLFIVLLIGVICFLCRNFSKMVRAEDTDSVAFPANAVPETAVQADPGSSNDHPNQSIPYTVFHIPRVRSRDCSRSSAKSTHDGSSHVMAAPVLQWSPSVDSSRSTVLSVVSDAKETQ